MTISRKTWISLLIFSLLSLLIWFRFTYPQFSFINLSVPREKALQIAKDYLIQEKRVNPAEYKHATVFIGSPMADQYLQKALGFQKELDFFKEHDFELFYWKIRFFRENQKEEYFVAVSAATGEITAFTRVISDSTSRPFVEKEEAQKKAIKFLKDKFNFTPEDYDFHSDISQKRDNRVDHTFIWAKRNVFIPWDDAKDSGGAKLLTMATISGEEILFYNKSGLDIPDQFKRYLSREKEIGRNLSVLFRIIFFIMLTAAIFYVIIRRNDVVMHTTKNFAIALTGILFGLLFLSYCNEFENVLYHYPTTSSFNSYLWRYIIKLIMDVFVVTISILMPCLAGESLHQESFPHKKKGAFLHYIISTIFSRSVFWAILLGYIVAMIMIGIQSAAFEFGIRHLGVWVEHTWMAQLSASYLPFFAALVIGISASFSEEIAFRIFSISLGKKILKSTVAAVIISSVIWGYGHSAYLVFPMWFRGLEVSLLGFFLAFIYLRYGIIPVIVAHYVFDVFWNSSAYLLGKTNPHLFYSSLLILLLPLCLGIFAYIKNKSEVERPLRWKLNRHQIFNLEILKNYLGDGNVYKSEGKEDLKKEIVSHGWDMAVVEIALEDLENQERVG